MLHFVQSSVGRYCALLVVSWLIFAAPCVDATSIIAPRNLSELAAGSDAVVVALAGPSSAETRRGLVFTTTTFQVTRSVAGELTVGATIEVQTPGGKSAAQEWIVLGAPRFVPDESYFLCLRRKNNSVWLTNLLAYGVLHEEKDPTVGTILTPVSEVRELGTFPRHDGAAVEPITPYRKRELLAHLDDVLNARVKWDATSVAAPARLLKGVTTPDPGCFALSNNGLRLRWTEFDSGGSITIFADANGDPSFSGNEFALIPEALQMWEDIPGSILDLRYGGQRNVNLSCSPESLDLANDTIVFGDPCSDIDDLVNCSGTIALGGVIPSGTHSFQGQTWASIGSWVVLMNNGAGCLGQTLYRLMLAHELGHGLGFSHVADSNAMMRPNCCTSINITDETCARTLYPNAADPVSDLICECNPSGDIELSWENDPLATNDNIYIQINGADSEIIDGTSTSYTLLEQNLGAANDISDICVQNANGVPMCCPSATNDCDGNGLPDDCDVASGAADCNGDTIPDSCQLASETLDCNNNQVLDACELIDCNGNGIHDECDIASGTSDDCNSNTAPDECDIASGSSSDANGNNTPDECEGRQRPGDLNADGGVDVSDAITLFQILFADGSQDLPCGNGTLSDASNRVLLDHNGDTTVNLADGVAALNWLFGGGAPPAAGEGCVSLVNCADACSL